MTKKKLDMDKIAKGLGAERRGTGNFEGSRMFIPQGATIEIREAKKAAKQQLKDIQGITGFGIGDNKIRVYIANPAVKAQLPAQVEGYDLEVVFTGDVVAEEDKNA